MREGMTGEKLERLGKGEGEFEGKAMRACVAFEVFDLGVKTLTSW